MKKVLKIFAILIVIICSIIILIDIWFISQRMENPNEIPSIGGYSMCIVVSGSMEPKIHTNDWVVIKKASQIEVKPHDVVVYKNPEKDIIVIHELLYIDKNNVAITKGLANDEEDIPFDANLIEGKYLFRIPFVYKIINIF